MRVRALLRLNRAADALDEIVELRPTTTNEDALLHALESSCHSARGSTEMARRVLAKIRSRELPLAVQYEIANARASIAWAQNSVEGAEAALNSVDVSSDPTVYGLWLLRRAWLASSQGQFAEQLDWLLQTCTFVSETPEAYDAYVLANAVQALVHLVREIAAPEAYAFADRMVTTLQWTDDLKEQQFLSLRGMAWASALRGSHEKALEYSYAARDVAPTKLWITACYADQAYLARMAGQKTSADAMLRHSVKSSLDMDWNTQSEERIALLNLIELAADDEVAGAQQLMDVYDNITTPLSPRLALAHDGRLQAMEDYVRANVCVASGARHEAILLLRNAFPVFESTKYGWRAAATALLLHSLTDDRTWLDKASEAIADFSDSSVARDIQERVAQLDDTRLESLTRAQRKVFDLLCEGMSDKAIGETLGISRDTVKNHAVRVRSAFGVRSRAELIASIHQKAS
jgi:DNA-binding CsgD family transcriptional regulator/tetratricopeptide (TPR) repeat protein